MPEIRQLPPSVVNKIAAGEVIERPASVVKELLENAVDAGATRIEVAVAKGGMDSIRVVDNGCGMRPDQLSLAIASHATSKIQDADDLFQVRTLGFRGEALASIAEVSQFRLRSRTADSDAGAELEVVGGRLSPISPCGCAPGTSVHVERLFFNTPVRRKFLRSPQTEMGHTSEAFTRIALAYPQVHFTLRHNDRIVYDLPPVESWRERIHTFFGEEIGENLIWVESSDGDISLSGYVTNPTVSRGNNRLQYMFLNGRHIRDRALGHALSEAYRGLLLTGRFPVAFLRLKLPAEAVDVNVHPTKLEVRFQDGGRIYSQLLGAIRKKFLSMDLTARVRPLPSADPDRPEAAHDPAVAQQHREAIKRWARGESHLPAPSSEQPDSGDKVAAAASTGELPSLEAAATQRFIPVPHLESPAPPILPQASPRPADPPESASSARSWRSSPALGLQLHNRYLVTENEEGMVVIDQHALHERILYEQLREKVLSGKLETQGLLVPEPVTLTASEAAAVCDARDLLAQLGLVVEPFGGDTVLISAYPAMLANLSPSEILRSVLEQLLAGDRTPDRRDLLDELLHMMSCKAAIKAGDRLARKKSRP